MIVEIVTLTGGFNWKAEIFLTEIWFFFGSVKHTFLHGKKTDLMKKAENLFFNQFFFNVNVFVQFEPNGFEDSS